MAGDVAAHEKPQYVPTRLKAGFFQVEILERNIIFQVIKLKESILIYINEKDHVKFNDLSLAVKDRLQTAPIGTQLIGDFNEEFSKNIACRLSRKLEKVVFLSCNVDQDKLLLPQLEKKIYEEIKNNPDMF